MIYGYEFTIQGLMRLFPDYRIVDDKTGEIIYMSYEYTGLLDIHSSYKCSIDPDNKTVYIH